MTTIQVKVKPNSRVSTLEQGSDGLWLARLKSPPVDGKANAELVALIAGRYRSSRVWKIRSRNTSRSVSA